MAITSIWSGALGGELKRDLRSFRKLIVSPHIDVILIKGDKESVRIEYSDVNEADIHVEVTNNTLRLYLEDARIVDKQVWIDNHRRPEYNGVKLTAYISYVALDYLEFRGNSQLTCSNPITSDQFTLKVYGENELQFDSIQTTFLKVIVYGENKIRFKTGKVDYQQYRLYGENRIDARGVQCYEASTTIYGESKVDLYSSESLRVSSFGESEIRYKGDASVSRRLIFGRSSIHKAE